MSLIYNATFDKNTRKLSFEDRAGNEIYSFIVPERTPVDDVTKPLTFKATQNGSTVTLKKNGSPSGAFQTSRDGGNTWEDYTLNTAITLNIGGEVSFRAKADRTSEQSDKNYFQFMMKGKIEAWHNVMSLYRTNDFATYESVMKYAFESLFKACTSLTKAPVLPATTLAQSCYYHLFSGCTSLKEAPVLPATTLAGSCYSRMFDGCTSLTKAPVLPATTIAGGCYSYMFNGCRSMIEAPALPATTLANYCYQNMFNGCWKLTKAPVLPATTLATYCYYHMFDGCTSLAEAHELPATTLSDNCYDNMFVGCTSLTKAPELPATTLAKYCYANMFNGCTSLTEAPALPATTLANICYLQMFEGCTSLTKAPVLPAITLTPSCYSSMFSGCTSLTEAPALPATTLSGGCYQNMFSGCQSLTKAPELTATTLANGCYSGMFAGCGSLNEVRCQMPSTISAGDILTYTGDGSDATKPAWLSGVSATGMFYTNADANWPSGASGIPTGWTRVPEVAPAVDDITKPLTFKATQDGSTVTLKKAVNAVGDFQTSSDGGNTWSDYTIGTSIALNIGDEVSFRAKADRTTNQDAQNYFYFQMTGKIEAWHNVMSMYRTNDFATYDTVVKFAFNGMFQGCASLTKAPALPATTLSHACYYNMFCECQSLTKAPELPATTLADFCYSNTFASCKSLKEVRISATTKASDSFFSWLKNVSATGDFYCDPNATIFPSGESGIPRNWTRHALSDYPSP